MMIKDLAASRTLDSAALAEVRGGAFDATSIWGSALFGSPVTVRNENYTEYNYDYDYKHANVQQNTLALFGSAAASNPTIVPV